MTGKGGSVAHEKDPCLLCFDLLPINLFCCFAGCIQDKNKAVSSTYISGFFTGIAVGVLMIIVPMVIWVVFCKWTKRRWSTWRRRNDQTTPIEVRQDRGGLDTGTCDTESNATAEDVVKNSINRSGRRRLSFFKRSSRWLTNQHLRLKQSLSDQSEQTMESGTIRGNDLQLCFDLQQSNVGELEQNEVQHQAQQEIYEKLQGEQSVRERMPQDADACINEHHSNPLTNDQHCIIACHEGVLANKIENAVPLKRFNRSFKKSSSVDVDTRTESVQDFDDSLSNQPQKRHRAQTYGAVSGIKLRRDLQQLVTSWDEYLTSTPYAQRKSRKDSSISSISKRRDSKHRRRQRSEPNIFKHAIKLSSPDQQKLGAIEIQPPFSEQRWLEDDCDLHPAAMVPAAMVSSHVATKQAFKTYPDSKISQQLGPEMLTNCSGHCSDQPFKRKRHDFNSFPRRSKKKQSADHTLSDNLSKDLGESVEVRDDAERPASGTEQLEHLCENLEKLTKRIGASNDELGKMSEIEASDSAIDHVENYVLL